ncbi:protein YgfX [Pseudomonas sp. NPDC078700]|uniref:protein YgfX n=1 Tax=Pseudomonas sp. NPDC078700 TaxID=3364424 RepID=UPI0037CC0F51
MSSQSSYFEFRWQPSLRLWMFYLCIQLLALIAIWVVDLQLWARASATLFCALHAAWVVPRYLSLAAPEALTALRRVDDDWQLWSAGQGWRSVRLLPDSLALPWVIVLRFRWAEPGSASKAAHTKMKHTQMAHTLCIPRDAMADAEHRRLRVRLKFSPRRWADAQ